MSEFDIQSWRANSTVLRYWRVIREQAPEWAANARTVQLARELLAPPAGEQSDAPAEESTSDPATSLTETTSADAAADSTTTDASRAPSASDTADVTEPSPLADGMIISTAAWESSWLYRGWVASRRFVKTSWLYRWLTTEPDPQVIVIDLRETLSVSPFIARLDRAIRDSIAVLPTSGGARLAYRLRTRFLEQPIRVVSGGVIIAVLVGLLGQAVSGSPLGFEVIVLAAMLLVAARGTQSTYSWAQLAAMPWYQVLKAVVSPPEPPDEIDGDDVRSSTK